MKAVIRSSVLGALCLAVLIGAGAPDAPVADAAMRGDVDAVRQLLREGADVNAAQGDGMSALHWAAEHGDPELTEHQIRTLQATIRDSGAVETVESIIARSVTEALAALESATISRSAHAELIGLSDLVTRRSH